MRNNSSMIYYSMPNRRRLLLCSTISKFIILNMYVEILCGQGRPSTIMDKDEGLEKFDATKLKKLRPSVKNGGAVTAGNASSISDGAAALVLMSGKKALQLGLQVIAKIQSYADAA